MKKWTSSFRPVLSAIIALAAWLTCGCNRTVKVDTEEEKTARTLADAVLTFCREADGRTRPAEAISAMAGVLGEQCIVAADEFKVREHTFIPGQRVFSDKINFLLCGESPKSLPRDSVFGMVKTGLAGSQYEGQMPDPVEIFRAFAAGIGDPEDWGKVPLSVSKEYHPHRLPLRINFDSRSRVSEILKPGSADKNKNLRISSMALAMVLLMVRDEVDYAVALKLALETVNGMAKTAPMKDEAIDTPTAEMKEAQHSVIKMGHP